jgi:ElaB/YqjD/DUF883 family membrane-anchored ribosome-binding protein
MPVVTDVRELAEAAKQRFDSGFEEIQERTQDVRRAIARGRHAAEDGIAGAVLLVRRRPLAAVAVAAAGGALVGAVIGFVSGRRARC